MGTGLEDLDLGLAIRTYLESEGVDIGRALAEQGYAAERKASDARERADRAGGIAIALAKARQALRFEQDGYLRSASGFGIAKVGEAQQRVDQLTAALSEACVNDPELISEAKRRAAR
jgi:hypothetical protein